jgi:hypothetical protein
MQCAEEICKLIGEIVRLQNHFEDSSVSFQFGNSVRIGSSNGFDSLDGFRISFIDNHFKVQLCNSWTGEIDELSGFNFVCIEPLQIAETICILINPQMKPKRIRQ